MRGILNVARHRRWSTCIYLGYSNIRNFHVVCMSFNRSDTDRTRCECLASVLIEHSIRKTLNYWTEQSVVPGF